MGYGSELGMGNHSTAQSAEISAHVSVRQATTAADLRMVSPRVSLSRLLNWRKREGRLESLDPECSKDGRAEVVFDNDTPTR